MQDEIFIKVLHESKAKLDDTIGQAVDIDEKLTSLWFFNPLAPEFPFKF